MLSRSAAGLTPATAAAGIGPQLVMAEPEDRRSAIIAGSLTTLLHAAAIGLLILLAWLAPPMEELIEVRIIRERPGADVEPAPARKIIEPRRQRTPVQAARRVTAQAVTQPRVVNLTPQQLKMNRVDKAVAPQQVRRRQVASTRAQARSFDYRVDTTRIDPSQLENVDVVPTDLEAPVYDVAGPREIVAEIQDPQAFAEVPEVDDVEYSGESITVISDEDPDGEIDVFDFDTNVGVYAGGDGAGGTGTAVGVVRCMESAFVLRYIDQVEERTKKRWQVPEGTAEDAKVVLRFTLDSSGAATQIEFQEDVDPVFGNSAIAAMRAASPFPPMNDNVRCLAGKKLRGTFTNPAM